MILTQDFAISHHAYQGSLHWPHTVLGFPLSRDFSNFQVPGFLDLLSPGTGPRDHGTFRVSRSRPALVPGPPGKSREGPGTDQITFFFSLSDFFLK
jgi:hypothetical protein